MGFTTKRSLVAIVASAALLSGCGAAFSKIVGVPIRESEEAIKAKDYPKLKAMCLGDIRIVSNIANHRDATCSAAIDVAKERSDAEFLKPLCGRRKEPYGHRYEPACEAMLEVAVKGGDYGHVRAMCDKDHYDRACVKAQAREQLGDLKSPDCATFGGKAKAALGGYLREGSVATEDYIAIATSLAKCGESKVIFENIAHFGDHGPDSQGVRILREAEEKSNGAVFKLFQEYIRANPGKAFLAVEGGMAAANHIGWWLANTNRKDQCAPLLEATKGAPEPARAGLLSYYVEVGCSQSNQGTVELLASDDYKVRLAACAALAKLGDMSTVDKVEIVAKNDRMYLELPSSFGPPRKEYIVADTCREAAGKIRLRGK